ncbi:MAG: pseudouridine synthase, partial [Planctomycetota bacterium]|nr:pseudouridine synthase [Planctomycetota bacterium]
DRDTSGVMVVAKNDAAHMNLAAQFEHRTVEKDYFALVSPGPDRQRDWIEQPIGVHPYQREKMAVRPNHPKAKTAKTFYEITERYQRFAFAKISPKTGRTHQIRVHFQHIGCPILADKLYSGQHQFCCDTLLKSPSASSDSTVAPVLSRQALHAQRLQVKHPRTGKILEVKAKIPEDIKNVMDFIRANAS